MKLASLLAYPLRIGAFLKARCKKLEPGIKQFIQHEINKLRRDIMATLAEVKQAISDEKAEVAQALTDLNKQIQDLKDQIANGTPVTASDLDDVISAVHDIFVKE